MTQGRKNNVIKTDQSPAHRRQMMGKYREFWLIQLSTDGGTYSDIRVMKPSDCDELERLDLPPGHDNINYNEVVPVIEKQALAEKDVLIDEAIESIDKYLTSRRVVGKELCWDSFEALEQTLSKLKEARKQFDLGEL